MNRPLRSRHRRTFLLLTLLLPVGVTGGLAVRPSYPAVDRNALPTRSDPIGSDQPLEVRWICEGDEDEIAIDVTIVATSTGDSPRLRLTPSRDLQRPGVLVYWRRTHGEPLLPGLDALHQSTWVGSLAGTAARIVELPVQAGEEAGQLLLFSLGHQEIFASATIPAVSPE